MSSSHNSSQHSRTLGHASTAMSREDRITADLQQALQSDPMACELLLTLAHAAAHSGRQSLTLNPIPASYLNASTREVDVDKVRDALHTIPALQRAYTADAAQAFVHEAGETRHLLHAAIFGTGRTAGNGNGNGNGNDNGNDGAIMQTPVLTTTKRRTLFSAEDRRNRSSFLLCTEGSHTADEALTAYHGSPVGNWYSIVHTGLKHLPAASGAQTGRAYGDGVYLARDFDVAASFAPHCRMGLASSRIQSLSLVGEFSIMLSESAAGSECTAPDGYFVISNMSCVRLVGLHVLASVSMTALSRSPRSSGLPHVDAVLLIALLYFVWLVWVGLAP